MTFLTAVPPFALLCVTIAFELVATTCMKYVAAGATWMWGGVVAGYLLCFSLFPIVLRSMPMSVAYALWSGIGTASSALIGAALFVLP